jgi:hypothetical protein
MRILITAFGMLLAACATMRKQTPNETADTSPASPQASAPTAKPAPLPFESALGRENEKLTAQPVTVKEQALEVEAAGVPTVRSLEQGTVQIDVPIGSQMPVTCYLYADLHDSAAALLSVINTIKKDGQVQVQSVTPLAIEMAGDAPLMVVEARYAVEREGKVLQGQVKLASVSGRTSPLLCTHDEPGYLQTMKRTTRTLAVALQKAAGASGERFREVTVTKLGALPIGFGVTTFQDTKDGGVVAINYESALIPRGPAEVHASDSSHVLIGDKAGWLREGNYFKAENGESLYELKLTRKKGAQYAYSGTHSGKTLSGALKVKDKRGLSSSLVEATVVRELLAGKTQERSLESYVPMVNPAATTAVKFKKGTAAAAVTVQVGPLVGEGDAKADGTFSRMSFQAGPAQMTVEQLYAVGAPP